MVYFKDGQPADKGPWSKYGEPPAANPLEPLEAPLAARGKKLKKADRYTPAAESPAVQGPNRQCFVPAESSSYVRLYSVGEFTCTLHRRLAILMV